MKNIVVVRFFQKIFYKPNLPFSPLPRVTNPNANPAVNAYDSLSTQFSISGPGGRPLQQTKRQTF